MKIVSLSSSILVLSVLWSMQNSNAQGIDTVAGKNLFFDGATNFVDTGDTSRLLKFTVECWVKSPNAPSSAQGKGPVHYEKNFQMNWDHVQRSARNSLVLNTSNGGWQAASFGPLLGNTWYHLVGTYDGDTLRAYTNGRLVSEKIFNGGPPVREEFSLKIGKHAKLSGSEEFFNGSVDEVRVWNLVRSADEIRKAMYHPLTGSEAGLKHYYQFNSFTGDSTLNAATGKNVPLISGPMVMSSEFPFGNGKTSVFQIMEGSGQSLSSMENGLVSLQIDSSKTSFPLLFTRINSDFNGSKPDTSLFSSQMNPYWLIRSLDTGAVYKSKQIRLDMSTLTPSISNQVNTPGALQIFNRPLHTSADWQFVDTCKAIAFGSGHFIFNGFVEGQMALGISKNISQIGRNIFSKSSDVLVTKTSDNQLELLFSKPMAFKKIEMLDQLGRSIQIWNFESELTETRLKLVLKSSVQKGIYSIRISGKALLQGTRFLID